MKSVVHFGAGNIGRGFIGALFAKSGYAVTFVDMNEAVIDALNEEGQYDVHIAADHVPSQTITNVAGLNNMTEADQVIQAIGEASYITTAIGPNVLKYIAPLIAQGLSARMARNNQPLYVIACENQIAATDILKDYIFASLNETEKAAVENSVHFFNSAVDRIVPIQKQDKILDVLVEAYYEWVVEAPAAIPPVQGMTLVDDLAPYIERKLFTVNTGHAVTAYLGYLAGKETIDQALTDSGIRADVTAALQETANYLVKAHGISMVEQLKYVETILDRFRNPYLQDSVIRVGRAPLRKLAPNDRLVKPAKAAQDLGLPYQALAKAIAAAFLFDVADDEDAVAIQKMISQDGIRNTVCQVCGLVETDPLTHAIVEAYERMK